MWCTERRSCSAGIAGVSCDSCMKGNFRGRRYKCLVCYDYDLCATCYEGGAGTTRHTADHPMQCIITRTDFGEYELAKKKWFLMSMSLLRKSDFDENGLAKKKRFWWVRACWKKVILVSMCLLRKSDFVSMSLLRKSDCGEFDFAKKKWFWWVWACLEKVSECGDANCP